MKAKINLVTMTDIQRFVDTVSKIKEEVILKDSVGHCVSAKSMLGALYSLEWKDVYVHCDKDITGLILEWIV